MLRQITGVLFAILASYATAVIAGDYVLDASTMGVGATAGENLVVKEGCLDPSKTSCTDKITYLTASSPTKVGNVQALGNLTGDFEVIVTADFSGEAKGINILTADNKGISLQFNGDRNGCLFVPNGVGEGGQYYGDYEPLPGWNYGDSFNEVKISIQHGIANVYINGKVLVGGKVPGKPITLDAGVVFDRVTIQGIKSNDRLSDIKVRGIQGSTTCSSTPTTPTTSSGDCTADYSVDGSLHVPCVRVPGAFGKTELYDVWMQQKFPTYAFDLDMNRVVVK